jgi:hypothetical protein
MAPTHLIAQIDWQTPLESAWQDVVAFVPRLIGFLLILLIGRIVAGIIRTLITKGLELIRFDAAMDRAGFGAPLERAGFADSGRFVALLIYYAILLLVLQMALGVFGPNPVQDALTAIVAFIPNIVVALAILVITGLIANVVRDLLEPAYANVTVGHLLRQGVTAAIWIIGGFAALDQLRVAENIVETLFTAIVGSLAAILVIKFGVGGIWAARDRFWPAR